MDTFKIMLTSTSLLALAACGGSNSGNTGIEIDPSEEALRIFSEDIGDLGDALLDGQTVSARKVAMAGINLNYDSGETDITDASEFKVELNDEGEVTLYLQGTTTVFTSAHREIEDEGEVYGYFTETDCDAIGRCISLFSYTGEIDELKSNGNGHLEVLNSQSNQVSDTGQPDFAAFAVVGTETRDAALSGLGSATYEGRTRFNIFPDSGFVDNGTSRTRLRSDLTMDADFGAGTISGVMDNFESRAPDESDYTGILGTVSMNETSFAVNGFEGTLTPDATFADDTGVTLDGSARYSGAFYGPGAEEVGGTFSISGTDEDGAFNGIGFFEGGQ